MFLCAASAKLMKEVFSATGEAITDEQPSLQTFCVGLEKALRHGQKGESGMSIISRMPGKRATLC